MLDIVKYLGKMNIKINTINKENIVFIDNDQEKTIKIKELEQYLFICLTDFIKDSK